MKISLNWLKDFVSIPDSISANELGDRLTKHTTEIESVEDQSQNFRNIIVGKILELKKHPQADRLQLVLINTGKEKVQIVCGAQNIAVGQFVPVALVGAILPGDLEIRKTKIRGEESNGMLCSARELGLGEDHSGILILGDDAKLGDTLINYLKLDDVIFELDNKSITHRPDLWGHYGIAREISAFLNTKYKETKIDLKKIIKKSQKNIESDTSTCRPAVENKINLRVQNKTGDKCARYMSVAIDGIQITESPQWMQARLSAVGVRPINNIVDITNYVMLELGQPLHAFDLDQLAQSKNNIDMIIRRAREKEEFVTLDNEKRILDKNDLLIADSEKALALAGVMGGANSEISNETNAILIECANFSSLAVRKTSQKLGLRTEASKRFEKSLDPHLCEHALARAIELVSKLCPEARIISDLADECDQEQLAKLEKNKINLDLDWLVCRIGKNISQTEVVKILEKLGFGVKTKKSAKNILEVVVPSWRATRDVSIPEDLLEEVARVYGYDKITAETPRVLMQAPMVNEEKKFENKVKDTLAHDAHFSEVYNYSFVGAQQLAKLKIDFSDHIRLANPIIDHHSMLRQSLVSGLLDNVKTNQANFSEIKCFEFGSIYLSKLGNLPRDKKGQEKLPYEERRIGLVLGLPQGDPFYDLKSSLRYLDPRIAFAPSGEKLSWADQAQVANICIDQKKIGILAKLDAKIANSIGIKKEVALAEISFPDFFQCVSDTFRVRDLPRFPAIERDLAFIVDMQTLYSDLQTAIIGFDKLISELRLFDVYAGDRLPVGKKSLAFQISFQAEDRTLTAEEIDKLITKLLKFLKQKFDASLRDF